jgi:hypothetical protein
MIKHEKKEHVGLMKSIGYPKHIDSIIYNNKCKKLQSGYGFPEQDLRSMVAGSNFTNKSCGFNVPTQPQNLNLKSATETMLKIDEIVVHECVVKYGII